MNGWRQTARAQFDSSVVVVFKIGDQFCFKLLYGCKLLQIKQLRFEEPKEIFHDSIIQAIPLSAHALPNVLAFQHVPILSGNASLGPSEESDLSHPEFYETLSPAWRSPSLGPDDLKSCSLQCPGLQIKQDG